MDIVPAGPEHDAELAALFAAYAAAHAHELGDQDVVAEGRQARARYAPPENGLLVAADKATVFGCVAFEAWGDGRCRMKRMFVPPKQRGRGLGRLLALAVIEAAKEAGYAEMVLDTSAPMVAATALYQSLGFEPFEPDYTAPCREVLYLRRPL